MFDANFLCTPTFGRPGLGSGVRTAAREGDSAALINEPAVQRLARQRRYASKHPRLPPLATQPPAPTHTTINAASNPHPHHATPRHATPPPRQSRPTGASRIAARWATSRTEVGGAAALRRGRRRPPRCSASEYYHARPLTQHHHTTSRGQRKTPAAAEPVHVRLSDPDLDQTKLLATTDATLGSIRYYLGTTGGRHGLSPSASAWQTHPRFRAATGFGAPPRDRRPHRVTQPAAPSQENGHRPPSSRRPEPRPPPLERLDHEAESLADEQQAFDASAAEHTLDVPVPQRRRRPLAGARRHEEGAVVRRAAAPERRAGRCDGRDPHPADAQHERGAHATEHAQRGRPRRCDFARPVASVSVWLVGVAGSPPFMTMTATAPRRPRDGLRTSVTTELHRHHGTAGGYEQKNEASFVVEKEAKMVLGEWGGGDYHHKAKNKGDASAASAATATTVVAAPAPARASTPAVTTAAAATTPPSSQQQHHLISTDHQSAKTGGSCPPTSVTTCTVPTIQRITSSRP